MTRARDLSKIVNNKMTVFKYTATASQTTFTGADDNSATLSYNPNSIIVTYNGIVLENVSEYTATNGTSIVLTSGAAVGAEVNIIAFEDIAYSGVVPTTGGPITGDVTVGGTLGVTGATTMSNNLGVKTTLKTTHADADVIQFGGTGYLANWEDAETYLAENLYVNSSGGYRYLTNSHASLYSQTTGKHQFRVAPSGSADGTPSLTTALEIDNAGRVTTPSQPSFYAYPADVTLTLNGSWTTVSFANTGWNTGNHYNTSNSTFTAPTAGRYLFSVNANGNYTSGAGGIPRAYWKINGSNVGNSIHLRGSDATHDGLEQRSQTVIFNLSANDTVKVVVGQNQWDLFGANSFTGYLIG